MNRVLSGKISALSLQTLAPSLLQQAPTGPRRAAWLAGRALLTDALFPMPLPPICHRENGKPAFPPDIPLWFNLSHSGDDIALAISDEGSIGCDIEVIRPRNNWRGIADAVFSDGERQQLTDAPQAEQLITFWRIWTGKEAILKQSAGQLWRIAAIDSTDPRYFVSQHMIDDRIMLAVCYGAPFALSRVITDRS